MDIHTYKANVLHEMEAIKALEYAKFLMIGNIALDKLKDAPELEILYKQSINLLELELRERMKKCQINLNEYFKLLEK